MQYKTKKIAILILLALLQLSAIEARNYWECDTHPKVICQKTQTCCRILVNDPEHHELIPFFECFEGINQICCGSRGVCAEDEYCNPILSKCQKIKLFQEVADAKQQKEQSESQKIETFPQENKKFDFLFDQKSIPNPSPNPEKNNIQEVKSELNKLESEFTSVNNNNNDKNYLPNIPLEMDDLLSFNYDKILESVPLVLGEFSSLNCSWRNLTDFAGGFLHGLQIFEPAYRNTTCEEDVKRVEEDWSDFFDFINTIKYDKDFFHKLHEAVDRLEEIHKEYRKKRKDCVPVWHKLSCVMKKVLDRVLDPEFPRKLADHTICHYHELKNKTNSACCALRHHEFYNAGCKFGDAYRFFMFWDYNSTSRLNLKDADNLSFIDEFYECGI